MVSARPQSIADRVEIAPGVRMPVLGLGTWKARSGAVESAVFGALELGYRLVDTSPIYLNEREIGRAIARSGVPRDELFVTTKLDGPAMGLGSARGGLARSLRRLGLDYVDLFLVHWPRSSRIHKTWAEMEALQRSSLTRAIGVSNYDVRHLEQLATTATIPPAVNQVKLNPLTQRRELQAYCRERGITLEAWAPVLKGAACTVPLLVEIGARHSKTADQVSLRWILQKGIVAIPKTVHEAWLRENADVFDFELTAEEMSEVDALGA